MSQQQCPLGPREPSLGRTSIVTCYAAGQYVTADRSVLTLSLTYPHQSIHNTCPLSTLNFIMAIDVSTLTSIPTCYATCSIGKTTDPLPPKLEAIASAGFQAIELSFPDLLSFASTLLSKEVQPSDYDDLCTAAKAVKTLCDMLGLKILILQPFANFEGWPEGSKERDDAFNRARGWTRIMQAAGTDMLQVT